MIDQTLMTGVVEFMERRARVRGESSDTLLKALRERFQGIHFTICSDDDIPARLPSAAESSFCRLYYVSSGGHCLRLSDEPEGATGLAVAMLDEDET